MTGKDDRMMYNVHSAKAKEFINHQEILDTIAWAEENKNNKEAVEALIERAGDCKGLTHREAALLLACEDPELVEKMYGTAKEIKKKIEALHPAFHADIANDASYALKGTYDAYLSDLMMPVHSGIEIGNMIYKENPDAIIILMSSLAFLQRPVRKKHLPTVHR